MNSFIGPRSEVLKLRLLYLLIGTVLNTAWHGRSKICSISELVTGMFDVCGCRHIASLALPRVVG